MINKFISRLTGVQENTIDFLLDPSSGIKKYFLMQIPLQSIKYIASFGTPILLQKQVDLVANLSHTPEQYINFVYIVVGLGIYNLIMSLFNSIERLYLSDQTSKIEAFIEDKVTVSLSGLDYPKFEDKTASMMKDVQYDAPQLPFKIIELVSKLISLPFDILGFVAISHFINPLMLLILGFVSITTFALDWYSSKINQNFSS